MKVNKTLDEYKQIVYTILTKLDTPITFSQLINMIQEIYCIDAYSEISAAIHNLIHLEFLHEITAPDYYVELTTRQRTKTTVPYAYTINEKLIALIPDARQNALDYDYTYTERFPISLVRYLDFIRQEHIGLVKCDQAHLLLSDLDFEPVDLLSSEGMTYLRTHKKDKENALYRLFADNKHQFRLKNYRYEGTDLFEVTLYLLPGKDKLYPDITAEIETLQNLLSTYLTTSRIEILVEKL